MPNENVEIVRRMYEAFDRGDLEAALGCFDPGVVLDARHRVDGGIAHGREALAATVAEWIGTWDGWRENVEEMRDVDNRVMVISTQGGRGKESGIEWENRFAMLFDVERGQITRWTIYDDVDEALEATGLRE
jgi:ketosteroid isomerase-like protein